MNSVGELKSYASLNDASANEARALNELIVGVLDNTDDVRRAVFALEQQAATLQRRLYHRTVAVEQLQARVRELGGTPATTQSVLGKAFAILLSVREPFTRNRREDLLQDVERGEHALKLQFNRCLTQQSLSAESREAVTVALDRMLSETDCDRNADGWSAQSVSATPRPHPSPLKASMALAS